MFKYIFLSVPVTNCSSKMSFLFLKTIKNRLRSSQGQEELDALGILFIENDITASINFEHVVIGVFAS